MAPIALHQSRTGSTGPQQLSSSSSSSRCRSWQPVQHARLPASRNLQRTKIRAIEEKRDTAGSEASSSPDMMSAEQLQKLAELRKQRSNAPQTSSNIVQGALDEAQLITWPTPGKALLDTVLVLAIVAATGSLLFGLNVALADAGQWWYSL